MKLRKRQPSFHSDAATLKAPKFLPGDPVILDDGTNARVDFARSDGQVCILLESGKREWVHEDVLRWPASFQPSRRR
jgi:hypothetical protein